MSFMEYIDIDTGDDIYEFLENKLLTHQDEYFKLLIDMNYNVANYIEVRDLMDKLYKTQELIKKYKEDKDLLKALKLGEKKILEKIKNPEIKKMEKSNVFDNWINDYKPDYEFYDDYESDDYEFYDDFVGINYEKYPPILDDELIENPFIYEIIPGENMNIHNFNVNEDMNPFYILERYDGMINPYNEDMGIYWRLNPGFKMKPLYQYIKFTKKGNTKLLYFKKL